MLNQPVLNPAGLLVPNSEGVVTATTAGTNYLLHDVPASRTAIIRKIRWYNRGASTVRIILGDTDTGAAGGVFTARMVSIEAIAGHGGEMNAEFLESHEFNATSNILAQISASVTGVDIRCDLEETGA
ncbi:MAG: hypothetical protein NTZ05_12385 [Chloroflexi bacterium]|nr:hypothetical protein [Chloroflexota bacterium]